MPPERFRLLIWMKLLPLLALPVPALFLAISPVSENWSSTTWYVLGAIAAIGAAAYVWRTWTRSVVVLDDAGMTLQLPGGLQTWPYEKLLKYRRIGKYRVRMCFDPDRPDAPHLHMHISADFADPLEVKGIGHIGQTGIDEYATATLRFDKGILANLATAVAVEMDHTRGIVAVEKPRQEGLS